MLLHELAPGDVLLGDAAFESYGSIAEARAHGCDVRFQAHGERNPAKRESQEVRACLLAYNLIRLLKAEVNAGLESMLDRIASNRFGTRSDRADPRAVQRKRKPHRSLMKPRAATRTDL